MKPHRPPVKKSPNSRSEHTEQAKFNRRMTAGLALSALAGLGIYAGLANSEAGIPANAPRKTVTVDRPYEGAQDIIRQVEPRALGNPQELDELETYINTQGLAANHQLELGQTVQVPIIDPSPNHHNSANH